MNYDNTPGSEDGPPLPWDKKPPTLLDRLGSLIGNLLAISLGCIVIVSIAWAIAWLIANFPTG